jgi:hypothetical protein
LSTAVDLGDDTAVLQSLDMREFKAFERFTVNFRETSFLAGPNNAGKSTIIAALRACTYMLRQAKRRRPTDTFIDRNAEVLGYAFSSEQMALVDENLRHEFRGNEARLVLRFGPQKSLTAVWPVETDDATPYYYLTADGTSVNTAREAAERFPLIGIVPILSPLDHQEVVLTSKYVRENLDGRLASRHFRNQLLLLDEVTDDGDDVNDFIEFAKPWVPELTIRDLRTRQGAREPEIDLFYVEPGSRREKEIFWAGDGMQIWLQLLLHVFRLRDSDAVILDEPDVFLHPDLQRRLVKLLESLEGQTITATHSAEVLAEAPSDSVLWIDRVRRRSVSAPDAATLAELVSSLGTQFNLRLARALRAKTVVFVEGDDMKVLRLLGATLGLPRVAHEFEIAVIPLQGFDNWERIEPFSWLSRDLLDDSVTVFAVLDRDYRPEAACNSVKRRLAAVGVKSHVWKRKELESYLLDAEAIAELSGGDADEVGRQLNEIAATLETEVLARMSFERQRLAPHDHQVQALEAAKIDFDASWADAQRRLWMCPPKTVLQELNKRLQAEKLTPVSFRAVARRMRSENIPSELQNLLEKVEES